MSAERGDSMRLADDGDVALTRGDIERARERHDERSNDNARDEQRDDGERG